MDIHLKKPVKYIKKAFRYSPINCHEKPYRFYRGVYPIPLLLTVSQLPTLAYIINYLASEKNNFFFDYLKIIKINSLFYISICRMIDLFMSFFPMIPVLILFKYYEVISYTSYWIIIFYTMITVFSTNCLFCLMASKFKNQSFGMILGIVSTFLGILVPTPIRRNVFLTNHNISFFTVFFN